MKIDDLFICKGTGLLYYAFSEREKPDPKNIQTERP